MTKLYRDRTSIGESEQCIKCGHPIHFHITQSRLEGARRIPTGRHRCMIAECGCMMYD